jgi:hypothetical protein
MARASIMRQEHMRIRDWRAQRHQLLLQQGFDLAGFGVASERFFRVQHLAVDGELKHATLAWDQAPRADKTFDLAIIQNIVRQTDGAGGIVSKGTVFKRDV